MESRRSFIKKTAVAGSAIIVAPTIIPAKAFGANDRINAAVLGLNGRGKSHVKGLMVQDNVQITTLCDPDMNILKKRQKTFKETYNKDVALEQDLRKVMDDKDIEIITARRTGVSHCPQSNMKLGAGIAPIPELIKKGIPVGLGTDSCASNNNLDLFQEMDIAAKLHKADTLDPTTMPAATVLKMTTIGAAEAIGLDRRIGSLEPGKQADLIVVNTRTPHLTPLYHPESQIVYAAKGSDVNDVIISGKILVRDKKLLNLDLDHIITKVNEIASEIGA